MKGRKPQQPQQEGGFSPPPLGIFQRPFTPMQPQPPPVQSNSGTSLDNYKVIQLLTTLTQGVQNQAKEVDELKKQMGKMAEFMG